MTPKQRFHLAWLVKRTSTPWQYTSTVPSSAFVDGTRLRALRVLKAKGFVDLHRESPGRHDRAFWEASPTDAGREAVKKYRPETPQQQLELWAIKAPQLRTLARFINEHLKGYEAVLRDWDYTPEHKLGNSRIVSRGQTRHGKRLEVRHRGALVHTLNGPDPDETNDRTVRFISRQKQMKSIVTQLAMNNSNPKKPTAMFSSETTKLLTALEDWEIVWILEGAYRHKAKEYYEYTALARTLRDAEAQRVPSPHPGIAEHQDREEELVSALRSAKSALKLANVLDAILKDVNSARHKASGISIAEFLKERKSKR